MISGKFALAAGGALLALASSAVSAAAAQHCVLKAGRGYGPTLGMAQFQSYEIIEQVTGNWPIKTDSISKPTYKCKPSGGMYECVAQAKVCKKG
jgi:hypothetical protein